MIFQASEHFMSLKWSNFQSDLIPFCSCIPIATVARNAFYHLDRLKGCSLFPKMQDYIQGLLVTSLSQEAVMPARTKPAGCLKLADSKCSGLPEQRDEKHYTNL